MCCNGASIHRWDLIVCCLRGFPHLSVSSQGIAEDVAFTMSYCVAYLISVLYQVGVSSRSISCAFQRWTAAIHT